MNSPEDLDFTTEEIVEAVADIAAATRCADCTAEVRLAVTPSGTGAVLVDHSSTCPWLARLAGDDPRVFVVHRRANT